MAKGTANISVANATRAVTLDELQGGLILVDPTAAQVDIQLPDAAVNEIPLDAEVTILALNVANLVNIDPGGGTINGAGGLLNLALANDFRTLRYSAVTGAVGWYAVASS